MERRDWPSRTAWTAEGRGRTLVIERWNERGYGFHLSFDRRSIALSIRRWYFHLQRRAR